MKKTFCDICEGPVAPGAYLVNHTMSKQGILSMVVASAAGKADHTAFEKIICGKTCLIKHQNGLLDQVGKVTKIDIEAIRHPGWGRKESHAAA